MRYVLMFLAALLAWTMFIQTRVPETPDLDIFQLWVISWKISPLFTIAAVIVPLGWSYILATNRRPSNQVCD
jgi:hypothetical protein